LADSQHVNQWRTQKIFMGGFHSVACGGHLYLVCGPGAHTGGLRG